jgi:hypothetical protein
MSAGRRQYNSDRSWNDARYNRGDRRVNDGDRITTGRERGLYKPRSATQLAATGPTGDFGARGKIFFGSQLLKRYLPSPRRPYPWPEAIRGVLQSRLKCPSNPRGVLPGPLALPAYSRGLKTNPYARRGVAELDRVQGLHDDTEEPNHSCLYREHKGQICLSGDRRMFGFPLNARFLETRESIEMKLF